MQKENKLRKNQAITLITLIVTVIVMLILAGVAIYFTVGKEGLLDKVAKASKEYESAYEKEKTGLDNLYSEMLIATNDDAKITISVEDLNKLIEEKVNTAVGDWNKLLDEKVEEKVTSFIPTPDYEKIEEIAFTNKSYTVQKDGYIQVWFTYTAGVDAGVGVYDGLFVNNMKVFNNNANTGWQNPITPPFLVKKGDVITYENKAQKVTGYYYPIRY